MLSLEQMMLIAAALLSLSVVASKASSTLGIPALVLFLVIGMLAGSDGPGGLYFDDARLAQFVGSIALLFILFSGGLDTPWPRVRKVLGKAVSLATIGVVVTAASVGAVAVLIFGFTWLEGLLLGAVISSTDAAAVFSVMRARDVRLAGDIEPLIEFESGSNDPMAILLTLGVTQLIMQPETGLLSLAWLFVTQMGLGLLLGIVFGYFCVFVMNRIQLRADGLYVIVTIAHVLGAFAVTALLGGSGFLAVYVAGMVMGNREFIHKRSLTRFHDAIAWLMQIGMFLTLGLLVFPSQLLPIAGGAALLALFLVFVARPLAVAASLFWARMPFRELLMVSWVGLRGAVPIILATFPLLAGVPIAGTIFNIVFFVVLVSVLLQGTTVGLMGRQLGLQVAPEPAVVDALPTEQHVKARLRTAMLEPGSALIGRAIVDAGLPPNVLIVMIERNGEAIIPSGATVLRAGDGLTILADDSGTDATQPALRYLT